MGSIFTLDNPEDFYISPYPVHPIQLRAYWLGHHAPVFQPEDRQQQSVILISALDYGGWRDYIDTANHPSDQPITVEEIAIVLPEFAP
jgi:hypothetical protein